MPEEVRPALSRRSIVRAGAWSAPVVAVAVAAPAASASTPVTDSYLEIFGLSFTSAGFILSFRNTSTFSTLTVTSLTIDVAYSWEAASYNYSPLGPQPTDPTDDDTWPPGYPGGGSESGGDNGQGEFMESRYDSSTGVHLSNTSQFTLAPGEILGDRYRESPYYPGYYEGNDDGVYDIFTPVNGTVDSTVLSWIPKGPRDPANPWDTGSGTWVPGQTYTATFTMNYTASVTPNTPVATVALSQTAMANWTA